MDALIGDGHVEERDYIAPGILRRVVARFPTEHHLNQFACSVRQVSKLLGTRAFRAGNGISITDFLRN
ncbi:hypothetical protein [Paraburkholderia youngii]|uniref:Uncharacterized protein n=1 Tax=Paraburkholderia youngii TaxID=2782701 RepID=A0A7Y6N3J7_9BURK|nr:hypothetical protein [Paraburkholderia youngii]NUY06197.1 hypothetical protein [Paraburkholderia youngii]